MTTVRANRRTVFVMLCTPLLGVAAALYLHHGVEAPYYNCGEIWFGGPYGIMDLNQARAGETCLWLHYRAGTRVQLTAVDARSSDTAGVNLFTVDPSDKVASIRDAISWAGSGIKGTVTGAATCRAMLSTAIGLQMVGCAGNGIVFTPLYRNYTHGFPSP